MKKIFFAAFLISNLGLSSAFLSGHKTLDPGPNSIVDESTKDNASVPVLGSPLSKCWTDRCLLPNCRCQGPSIPGNIPPRETPQIIFLTFDDAVTGPNMYYYREIFTKNRTNPNGCSITGTFFVSHDWTDYPLVNALYSSGHEIASHSIRHIMPPEKIEKSFWSKEFAGQRLLIHEFANISVSDIKGMRAPFLQGGGNVQFEMMSDQGFSYDSSMVSTRNEPPTWPWTMDYKRNQDCIIPPCPTKSYPGIWQIPLVQWLSGDEDRRRCAMVDTCQAAETTEDTYKLIKRNFDRHYTSNRAPFGIFLHATWFLQRGRLQGLEAFLDKVLKRNDVWVITMSQGLQWMRTPVTNESILRSKSLWKCSAGRPSTCPKVYKCNLKTDGVKQTTNVCKPCKANYELVPATGI